MLIIQISRLIVLTTTRKSGVGDFGEEGIQKFKNDHVCNAFCTKLELEELENERVEGEGDNNEE